MLSMHEDYISTHRVVTNTHTHARTHAHTQIHACTLHRHIHTDRQTELTYTFPADMVGQVDAVHSSDTTSY